MNLNYNITEIEKREVAERVRESPQVWDAFEYWCRRRLAGADAEKINEELIDKLELETDWYVNNPPEQAVQDDEDGPWEAA